METCLLNEDRGARCDIGDIGSVGGGDYARFYGPPAPTDMLRSIWIELLPNEQLAVKGH